MGRERFSQGVYIYRDGRGGVEVWGAGLEQMGVIGGGRQQKAGMRNVNNMKGKYTGIFFLYSKKRKDDARRRVGKP